MKKKHVKAHAKPKTKKVTPEEQERLDKAEAQAVETERVLAAQRESSRRANAAPEPNPR